MASVQQMAMERALKRWSDPKGSEDEILNYFQGYSQGAYDILNMFKEIINMGFGLDGLNYYIENRLGEMSSNDEQTECRTVSM
jgi:hypothetical protein